MTAYRMVNYRDSQNKQISLIKQISSSGEGVIWQTDRQGYLAKIYHQPTPLKIQKLKLMVVNPPDDPTRGQNHVSIAWPVDLIKDNRRKDVGFLMPEIKNSVELLEVYHSKVRNKKFPQFNWYCLHITALNVALIVNALHSKNYIIGDMKTQNFLVNGAGQVSIVDTDSFQLEDSQSNKTYRCPVGSEGFTPPELIGKDLSSLTQTRYNDRFRLGVIIYLLLFTHHPFMGAWKGNGDPPGQDESISKGFWPYGINSPLQPSINTVALEIVHSNLKNCFLKCFNDGHKSPTTRPSPQDWANALTSAIKDLEACSRVNNHLYNRSYGKCYWCDRSAKRRVDIFPAVNQPILPPFASVKSPQPGIVSSQPGSVQPVTVSNNIGFIIIWAIVIIGWLIIIF